MQRSHRVVVTDDNIRILVTSYRDRHTLAEIEIDPLLALKLADDLIGAARRSLHKETDFGKPQVEQLAMVF